jgi:hypothetical protein
MWIGTGDHVIPLEDELAKFFAPTTHGRRQGPVCETTGSRRGKPEEGRHRVSRITRPPANLNLLGAAGIAHDELLRRRIHLEA